MPRKQHLYIFLNKNELKEYDISTRLVFKYMNQFVIEEEAQTEIIQLYQLQEYREIPKTAKDYFWAFFGPILDQFWTTSFLTGRSPETILSQNVQRSILKAIEKAGMLDDGETDNHFLFGRYNDLLAEFRKENVTFIKELLPPVFTMQYFIYEETDLLGKFVKKILNSTEISSNNIRVTSIQGTRYRLTREAPAPEPPINVLMRDIWNHLDVKLFNPSNYSILGDDIETFFNEIKQGKYVNAGYGFYLQVEPYLHLSMGHLSVWHN